jgi:hypothetical protein
MAEAESVEKSSRRAWLSEIAGLFWSAVGAATVPSMLHLDCLHAASNGARSLARGLSDLYDMFKGEVAANFHDNVYQSLGNQFQLDGVSYLQVSRAMADTDYLGNH